ncbi:MAG TPA: HAMP domain-containing sensor histidine kinase [Blastocatellia bacterium]|nr:HAMP domain-containing sensor histidine kinase [Blastocatellia bacterium]
MSEALLTDLLAALDVMVVERLPDGTFARIGTTPAWFLWLYPESAANPQHLRLDLTSPFLENFLVDAESFWNESCSGQLKSGSWEEKGPSGKEDHLEAAALCLGERKILLVELLGVAHEERRRLLQIAREKALLQAQLTKETQKKEILLHCIAHDLVSLLMGVKVSFSLLGAENLSPTGKDSLTMGQRQSAQQERLVNDIVQAFSAEMESLDPFKLEADKAPDMLSCVRAVVNELAAIASLHKVNLQLDPATDCHREWKVVGERMRLQRVIMNLVENALRVGPPFSVVNLSLRDDGTNVVFNVEDEGTGVAAELVGTLFQKFAPTKSGQYGFGLYFCRIMVERWGGSIGYAPRPNRGSRFWIKLPKVTSN